ncbi:APC family permease [Hyphomicrobium sp.]|uniref:APC family permease n=1 Tax=Hyphomicrobium sp. TaxID=82 RepID=UPI002D772728|nr:amino acid permease [Hyphomicrobium sp.]HET6389097.1 amino acid permease [Hyphomicrobium sp.]
MGSALDVRTVSTVTATALAVADMIGIGVFTSLGFQVASIPSAFSVLLLWIVGGVAALCGALAYAELAAAFPRSGGEYNFLSRIYHPSVGFLAGWISATLGFSAPIALAAMAFGVYFKAIIPGVSPLLLGLGVVWIVTAIHLSGIKHSAKFQNVSTVIKGALILALIIAGIAVGTPQPISFAPSADDMSYIASAPFAVSLVFVMYAYSGWNAATYIAGEIREPAVSLPRSIVAATLIVIMSYVALNAVFLYTTPISAMAGQIDVALVAGKHIFGEVGGRIVGALICIGLISSISAMTWIGPRVTMAMGKDHAMLGILSRTTSDGVPKPAILLQLAIVSLLLMTQSFEAVLDTIQFSLTLCSFLAVLGVIVLRWTSPGLPRPYRTWGYPITPFIFLGVTAFMMYYLVIERPLQSLAGVAIMLTGLAVYAISQQRSMIEARPR